MTKHIYRVEVSEVTMPKKMNWLGDWEEDFDEDSFQSNIYEVYFPNFEEVSRFIDSLTEGYQQYWANPREDIYGDHAEDLEYHNGSAEWDKEYHISISQVKLIDSLLESIKEVTKVIEKKI